MDAIQRRQAAKTVLFIENSAVHPLAEVRKA
jgi:hypothetical protein